MTRFYQDLLVSVVWIAAIGVAAGLTLDITRRVLRTEEALIDEDHPGDRETLAVDLVTTHTPGEEGIFARVACQPFSTNDAEALRRFAAVFTAAADAIEAFEPPPPPDPPE